MLLDCAPQLPNRPPARPPPVRRVSRRESPVVGAEPEAVPAASSPSPFPSSLRLTHRPPSRLRHPPAPHTQDENALPGTTQQHLDGFGHGPAVAYPQHHLQPLRLGGRQWGGGMPVTAQKHQRELLNCQRCCPFSTTREWLVYTKSQPQTQQACR